MAFLNETGLKTFLTNCDKRYLKLSGGNLTGDVTGVRFNGKSPTQDATKNASSNVYGNGFYLMEKNNRRTSCFECYQKSGKKVFQTQFGSSVKKSAGGYTSVVLGAYTNETGDDLGYYVSHPNYFRSAIRVTSGSSVPSSDSSGAIFIQV